MSERPINEAEDKLVDADLRELLGASQAPDLIDRTLRRINEPRADLQSPARIEPAAATGRRAETAPRRWPRVRYAVEALVLLIALGLTVWVAVAPRPPAENRPDGVRELPASIAAAPQAEFERKNDALEVKRGWFLVTDGAPPVVAAGVEIKEVRGVVLLRVGALPHEGELEAIAEWLKQNSWETNMVKTFKRWMQVGSMALVVLAGSALVNNERVEAEKEAPVEAPAPYVVSSVADIERLPKDTTAVIGAGLTDAHLELLGKVTSLRSIVLRQCGRVSDDGLRLLAANPEITSLDVRDCPRLTRNGLQTVSEFSKLTEFKGRASVLLSLPSNWIKPINFFGALGRLSAVLDPRGKDAPWTDEDLRDLVEMLPNITELGMGGSYDAGVLDIKIGDMGLKALGGLAHLEALDFTPTSEMSDAGFAYLKACRKLRTLKLNMTPQPIHYLGSAMVEQVAGIQSLEHLEFKVGTGGNVDPSSLKNSRNLKVLRMWLGVCEVAQIAALGALSKLEELELNSPNILGDVPDSEILVPQWSGMKELKRLRFMIGGQKSCALLPIMPSLEDLRIHPHNFNAATAEGLARQPKLRVLRLGDNHSSWSLGTRISDVVEYLGKLANLEILELAGQNFTWRKLDLTPLKGLKKLKEIRTWRAFLEFFKDIKEVLPDCKVVDLSK